MVEYAIKEKTHKVFIRCDELANARSEGELLSILAKQVGYIPLFQFMSTLNNLMDMAITATTGQKAGKNAALIQVGWNCVSGETDAITTFFCKVFLQLLRDN